MKINFNEELNGSDVTRWFARAGYSCKITHITPLWTVMIVEDPKRAFATRQICCVIVEAGNETKIHSITPCGKNSELVEKIKNILLNEDDINQEELDGLFGTENLFYPSYKALVDLPNSKNIYLRISFEGANAIFSKLEIIKNIIWNVEDSDIRGHPMLNIFKIDLDEEEVIQTPKKNISPSVEVHGTTTTRSATTLDKRAAVANPIIMWCEKFGLHGRQEKVNDCSSVFIGSVPSGRQPVIEVGYESSSFEMGRLKAPCDPNNKNLTQIHKIIKENLLDDTEVDLDEFMRHVNPKLSIWNIFPVGAQSSKNAYGRIKIYFNWNGKKLETVLGWKRSKGTRFYLSSLISMLLMSPLTKDEINLIAPVFPKIRNIFQDD